MFELKKAEHNEAVMLGGKTFTVFYFAGRQFPNKIKVVGKATTENFLADHRWIDSDKIQCMNRAIYSCSYFENILVVVSPEMLHFDRATGFSPATTAPR